MPSKRRRTNIVSRSREITRVASENQQDLPITSEMMGNAGRRAAYVITGDPEHLTPTDRELVRGFTHYDRQPRPYKTIDK